MFDFLNLKLTPKVRCSSATMDGYEAENLISPNGYMKSRGFLCYTTIKPPVDLDFELLCSISVGYVFISTVVGTQRTTAIELFARNGNLCEFTSIARAFFDHFDGVFFCNSRLYSASSPPPNYNKRYHLCFLRSDRFRVFINADQIRVKILRTDRSVPCIKKIEIWGRVSKLCSKTTANTVNSLMQPRSHATKTTTESSSTSQASNNDAIDEIPEDFKDALTFEIMTIPMTLPSGSTVDSSTLEKFIENEASQGRQPSDPFTGLKFTESRKPVVNTALKSRIDMFLLQNADVTKNHNVRRTVGRSSSQKNEINTIINQSSLKKRKAEEEADAIPCDNDFSESIKKSRCDDDELNALIEKAVSSKDFIRFTAVDEAENKQKTIGCSECESTECLYLLPCKHLYCRKCLMGVCSELKCKSCQAPFTRADPKKFHVA